MTRISTRTTRRMAAKTAAVTVALCLATGVGGAYAYWATVGAGSGAAANGTMATVTAEALVPGEGLRNTLVPGGTADVAVRATNPNTFAVQVYAIRGNGAATPDGTNSGCTTTGVKFVDPPAPLAPAVSIPANSSVLITLQGAASMSTDSLSACQGATFTLPVTLEARK